MLELFPTFPLSFEVNKAVDKKSVVNLTGQQNMELFNANGRRLSVNGSFRRLIFLRKTVQSMNDQIFMINRGRNSCKCICNVVDLLDILITEFLS